MAKCTNYYNLYEKNGDYIKVLKVFCYVFFFGTAALASAEAAECLNMDAILELTDCVFVASMGATIDIPMSYIERTEYYFNVLEVLKGPESLKGTNTVVYLNQVPGFHSSQSCGEGTHPIIPTGSGYEMDIEQGDTVVVFSNIRGDSLSYLSLVRIEPVIFRENILSKIVRNGSAEN